MTDAKRPQRVFSFRALESRSKSHADSSANFLRVSLTVGNGVPSFLARSRICSIDRPKTAAARIADAPLAISIFSRSVSLSVHGLFRSMFNWLGQMHDLFKAGHSHFQTRPLAAHPPHQARSRARLRFLRGPLCGRPHLAVFLFRRPAGAAPAVAASQLRRYRLFRGFERHTSNTACGLPLASYQPLHSTGLGAVVWPRGLTFVGVWLVLAGHFVMTVWPDWRHWQRRGIPNLDDGPGASP